MTTCSVRDPLAEAQAEISKRLSDWVASGRPRPLDFMIHFAGKSAALLRRAGQSDEWIRAAIVPVLQATIETYPASVRPGFLQAVEGRLAEALPPIVHARPRVPIDTAQDRFDRWIEESASADDSPVTSLVREVKDFARQLRAAGKTDAAIRARAEGLILGSTGAMVPADRERVARLVRQAIAEALGAIG